ncbi:solute carrier family 66 member 3 isoform X4 [Manis javanica]|uniref:solute carrier family 66 member 3 isoform X4 n=1 Tax=Manis javanica TaxID=9974 RepID=UPI003C6D27F9
MFHCPARGALPGFSLYPPNLDENGTVCASPGDSELHAWVQHRKVNQQRGSRLLGLGGPSLGPALPPPQLGGTPEGHRDRPGDVLPPQSPGSAHCGAQTGPAVGAPPPTPAGGGTQLLDVSAGCAVLVCDLPRRLLVPLPETQASGAGSWCSSGTSVTMSTRCSPTWSSPFSLHKTSFSCCVSSISTGT